VARARRELHRGAEELLLGAEEAMHERGIDVGVARATARIVVAS
jgi:hypothetical protein